MKANEYKKMISARREQEELFDVTLPSGFVWKLRKFPMQQYVLAGRLPTFFASLMKSANTISAEAIGEKLAREGTDEDILESVEFIRKIINYCAVEPRISLNPQSEDEIAPEEIDEADFMALQAWCMSGGAAHLAPFRPERQQPAVAGSNGKANRKKRK